MKFTCFWAAFCSAALRKNRAFQGSVRTSCYLHSSAHFVLLRNRSASLPIPAARQGRAQERTSKKKSLLAANFKTCRKACKSTAAFLKHIFFRKRNFPRNPVSASQESKDWIFRRFCAIFYLCRKFLKSAVTSFSFFQMKEIRWSPAIFMCAKMEVFQNSG